MIQFSQAFVGAVEAELHHGRRPSASALALEAVAQVGVFVTPAAAARRRGASS